MSYYITRSSWCCGLYKNHKLFSNFNYLYLSFAKMWKFFILMTVAVSVNASGEQSIMTNVLFINYGCS